MAEYKNPSRARRKFKGFINESHFAFVTVGGVITQSTSNMSHIIGKDLLWLKNELHKFDKYGAEEIHLSDKPWQDIDNTKYVYKRKL